MSGNETQTPGEVTHIRIKHLEQTSARHGLLLEEIRDSMKEQVRQQAQIIMILGQQDDHEDRLRVIERQVPLLSQSSNWVTTGVTALIAAVFTALVTAMVSGKLR